MAAAGGWVGCLPPVAGARSQPAAAVPTLPCLRAALPPCPPPAVRPALHPRACSLRATLLQAPWRAVTLRWLRSRAPPRRASRASSSSSTAAACSQRRRCSASRVRSARCRRSAAAPRERAHAPWERPAHRALLRPCTVPAGRPPAPAHPADKSRAYAICPPSLAPMEVTQLRNSAADFKLGALRALRTLWHACCALPALPALARLAPSPLRSPCCAPTHSLPPCPLLPPPLQWRSGSALRSTGCSAACRRARRCRPTAAPRSTSRCPTRCPCRPWRT